MTPLAALWFEAARRQAMEDDALKEKEVQREKTKSEPPSPESD